MSASRSGSSPPRWRVVEAIVVLRLDLAGREARVGDGGVEGERRSRRGRQLASAARDDAIAAAAVTSTGARSRAVRAYGA